VAYITGGASGQGAAHTAHLAREGATVYFGDINRDAGAALQRRFVGEGLDTRFLEHDVRSLDQWAAVHNRIESEFGRLDILVNNAGMIDLLGPEEATEESWQRTIDVNQKSVFLGTKSMIGLLRKSKHGAIINVASVFGLIGVAGYFAYIASKGSIAAMTKAAAVTYAPDGVRVNSIHPGYVSTPMLASEFAVLPADAREASLQMIPLRRFAYADEISPVVAFLASDDASYITGAEIVIDGGLLAGR
jgi:NAD(P)-dependent dehydrogenase (short-subunit alcohol dehydrogenase family)